MSTTSGHDPPIQGMSTDSGQTLPPQTMQPITESSASKRVCFYKSGDYKFSGHRMIITARTFKTFDALLDALSRKVPLPFGVRTISTPRGTHFVRALDDLQDGGAYVCSDQKRVKPLNLDQVSQQQVPWNTTRLVNAGRRRRQELRFRQFGGERDAVNRPAKVTERVAVRTPRKLLVIKNRDSSVRRNIVLQRRTAPTFDALLDYLSQILQFPVLKLYSTDGRRVDGLAALILCSGVVVAAGNEPFRLGNQRFQRTGQTAQIMYVEHVEPSTLQPRNQKEKPFSSGRGSRNFSPSSERLIVNQINMSKSGRLNGYHQQNSVTKAETLHHRSSVETCGPERGNSSCILPHEDDIEKSFCVNADGSMTVEMKVRLTLKEEEMLHWTTTLSRSSLGKRPVCASVLRSGDSSPDSNNAVAKDSTDIQENEPKVENCHSRAMKGVGFTDDQNYEGYTSRTLGKAKTQFKRTPTPGPQHVSQSASVESVKMLTETGIQQSTLGHYSYSERNADGDTTEGYCLVRHSSSSNRPIPKPRKTSSSGASNKHSSVRSSEAAEILQMQNGGMEVTETVMHIYESQGCYDNYFANEEFSADGASSHGSHPVAESKQSSVSAPLSSSNDCDMECNWPPSTADSAQRQKEEMLSLSSEPESLTHQATTNQSLEPDKETVKTDMIESAKKANTSKSAKKKKLAGSTANQKSSASTSSTDRNNKGSFSKHSKNSSSDKISTNASIGKNSLNLLETQKKQKMNKEQMKIRKAESKKSTKDSAVSLNSENVDKITPPSGKKTYKGQLKDNGHNINTQTKRSQMRKNASDFSQAKQSLSGKKALDRPKSMVNCGLQPSDQSLELTEVTSMPSFNPSPSEIHQYVENWLEKVSLDPVPYTDQVETDVAEPQTKVVFKIGDDSESDELNECAFNSSNATKKSSSCLSVPLCDDGPATALLHAEQRPLGLCVSMPSFRTEHESHENKLRLNKSVEAINQDEGETSSLNFLSPKESIKPVLRQLCSSIQCIRRVPTSNSTPTLQNSNSLPNFSTQVASVFGSSCRALLSFLSVKTLQDNLNISAQGEEIHSRTTSEAMLMMESLQKISAIEDEEEQRASLSDLQSKASSQLRESWKDFQTLRQRLESEPLSPKVSETEFALDVISDGGDAFEEQQTVLNELMEELNMPQDLREEITSTIQHSKSFYPAEESTYAETVRKQSFSEEEVERFDSEYEDVIKSSPELENTVADKAETKVENNNSDEFQKVKPFKENDTETLDSVTIGEHGNRAVKDEEEEENFEIDEQTQNEAVTERQEKSSDYESVDKVEEETEEEMAVDEEVTKQLLEEGNEESEMCDEEILDRKSRQDGIAEDTDERECAAETGEEEKTQDRESITHQTLEDKSDSETSRKEEAGTEEENEFTDDTEEALEEDNEERRKDMEEMTEMGNLTESANEDSVMKVSDVGTEENHIETEEPLIERVVEEITEYNKDETERVQKESSERQENVEEKCDEVEEDRRRLSTESNPQEDSVEEAMDVAELAAEGDEDVDNSVDEDESEFSERSEQMETVSKEEDREGNTVEEKNSIAGEVDVANMEEEYFCEHQQNKRCTEAYEGQSSQSPSKYSSEGQFEKGLDSVVEADEEEEGLKRSNTLTHPVEISQELLDFVNDALQSYSLIFTYDTQGNVRIVPENAEVVQTKQRMIQRPKKDSSYGLKCLPSPITSDLSDYRPETSGSGGYKTQESVDLVSEIGEECSEEPRSYIEGVDMEQASPNLSVSSCSRLKSAGSFSSFDTNSKASKDLSYFSAASSIKADTQAPNQNVLSEPSTFDKDSADGVLIDRGRWLLKENHLIRKSPPVSLGMYGNLDSTSIDTGHENTSEDSLPQDKIQQNPLEVISSSELEEMAKPLIPKCTYYNMPHGSDSDPFLDDVSVRSGKHDASAIKKRGFRVSPVVDTSKTVANRNGSLSSFASVEFKIPDRKVHPEKETSAVRQPRRTSNGEQGALQAQDSLESLRLRCGQYCPIL